MALENTDKYRFRYVRTAGGKLSGPSMIIQTEQALSELGNTALENTEDSLTMAQQALANSEAAVNTAQNASADASEALTIARDARERAINANDAATQAQKTADQAESDAAAAQADAAAAQSTADYAQTTAEEALQLARQADTNATTAQSTAETADAKADAAQEAASAAQDTADGAQSTADNNYELIQSLGNEITNVSETLNEEIQKQGFWFEYDDYTTDVSIYDTALAKKYLVNDAENVPEGTSAPYWFWNYVREDGGACIQWIRTSDGTIYSREGNVQSYTLADGTVSFSLSILGLFEANLTLSASDNALAWAIDNGTIETQSYGQHASVCTVVYSLSEIPTEGDITADGSILGTLNADGEIVPDMTLTTDLASLSLDSAVIDTDEMTLTLTFGGDWANYSSADTTWSDWATLSGGDISSSTLAVQVVGATPNCYRRAALPEGHQTYVTVFANTQVNIDGKGYISTQDVNLQLDDVVSASARAGTDMYIYACAPSAGTEPTFVLSLNSTVPDGYTADNSRKIGGFHCLCAAVGTISGHALSGYAAGDVLPDTVWDLRHHHVGDVEGRFYYKPTNSWHTIYALSWNGEKLVSVYGGTVITGTSANPMHAEKFVEQLALVGGRLPMRDEFVGFAKGSNEETNIQGSAAPGTTGGHVDTAGRRMISNYGAEDCCGVYWWWTSDIYGAFNYVAASTYSATIGQYGGGNTSGNYYLQGYGWDASYNSDGTTRMAESTIDGSGVTYGDSYGVMPRALVGAFWGDGSNCGSRAVSLSSLSARAYSNGAGRGAGESVELGEV